MFNFKVIKTMKKLIVLSLAAMVCGVANAQQPQQERNDKIGVGMTPVMSEYWSPQPKVVTPGNQATASAPSDAIVLFDGTEKSLTDNWVTPQRDGSTADKKTTDEIVVPAGDVVITAYGEDGETWQAIVVEKIVFTPFESQEVTVGETGFATIGLPFATTVPAGVTAYAVQSVNDSKVKMSAAIPAGTTIPANEGFVIVAAPHSLLWQVLLTKELTFWRLQV